MKGINRYSIVTLNFKFADTGDIEVKAYVQKKPRGFRLTEIRFIAFVKDFAIATSVSEYGRDLNKEQIEDEMYKIARNAIDSAEYEKLINSLNHYKIEK